MIHFTERIVLRHEYVLEYQLTSIGPSHTKFVKFASAGKAWSCAFEDKGSDAFGTLFGICLCIDDDVVGIWSLKNSLSFCFLRRGFYFVNVQAHICDPHLGAVE